jgi:hypothetical protein
MQCSVYNPLIIIIKKKNLSAVQACIGSGCVSLQEFIGKAAIKHDKF